MICSYYANYIRHIYFVSIVSINYISCPCKTLPDGSHWFSHKSSLHFVGQKGKFYAEIHKYTVREGEEVSYLHCKSCWGWLRGNNCKTAFLQWQNYTLLEARLKQNNCKRIISNFAPRQILSTKADTKQCKISSSGKESNIIWDKPKAALWNSVESQLLFVNEN